MTILTERQEQLLSYLVGLALVGHEVTCQRKEALKDLGWRHPTYFSKDVKSLSIAKAIKVIEGGIENRNRQMLLVVLKRPEQFTVVCAPKRLPSRLVHYAGYDAMEAA